MPNCIALLFEQLLKLLLPSTGRHRAIGLAEALARAGGHPRTEALTAPPPTRRQTYMQTHSPTPLRAEDCALVRPYVRFLKVGPRRRTLWLAVRGVDIPLRLLHSAKAAA
ncbi:hypothetical protein ACZ90_49075 [Streptomyces albus subsp. albus]|nr:hypothetical protein ACZ90_49075 [Streptomyces albus subsp. albus]